MQSQTFERVKQILVNRFSVKPEHVTLTVDLQNELNLDSIDATDLLLTVNKTFLIQIPDQALGNIHTVSQLVEVIESFVAKRSESVSDREV